MPIPGFRESTYISKFILAAFISSMFSCHEGEMKKTERPGEPDIFSVNDDDKEMNEAINKAKITLAEFDLALDDSLSQKTSFAIKVKFETKRTTEHIWFTEIKKEDGNYSGVLSNVPSHIEGIKLGERRKFKRSATSDWMYEDQCELRGGYTIRLLRRRMSQAEREKFDAEFELEIKDP